MVRYGPALGSRSSKGLQMILDGEQLEYLCSSQTAGFRVLIHNQSDYPFPASNGYNIPLGSHMKFSLRQLFVGRSEPPYGDCR